MIVADASVVVEALLTNGHGRHRLTADDVHVPHLVDSEVADAMRKLVARDALTERDASRALEAWARWGVRRYGLPGQLARIWELRHNLSAYDAGYVALAESLGCALVTADARLSAATGPRCPIETIPQR